MGLGTIMALHGGQTFDVTLGTVELSCWKTGGGGWGPGVRDLSRYTLRGKSSLLPNLGGL